MVQEKMIEIAPSLPELVEELREKLKNGHVDHCQKTPFPLLNELLGGGLRGFVCLAALPGAGKSTFAQQIAIYAARMGTPVLYVDFEHTKIRLLLKFLASYFSKTIETVKEILINDGELTLPDTFRFFTVWDKERITPDEIQCNLEDIGGKDNPTLLVLDSLHKLPAAARNPRESVNIWVRQLENIKNRYPVTILTVSEISRGEGGKNYSKPRLSSLKESGDIEYTAEQVITISPIDPDTKYPKEFDIDLIKNRFGEGGPLKSALYSHEDFIYARWTEVSI